MGIKANKDSSMLIHKANQVGQIKAKEIAKKVTPKDIKKEGKNLEIRKGKNFHFPSHSWTVCLNYLSLKKLSGCES